MNLLFVFLKYFVKILLLYMPKRGALGLKEEGSCDKLKWY